MKKILLTFVIMMMMCSGVALADSSPPKNPWPPTDTIEIPMTFNGDVNVNGDLNALFRKPATRSLLSGFESADGWDITTDTDCVGGAYQTDKITIPAVLYDTNSLYLTVNNAICTITNTGTWDLSDKDLSIALNIRSYVEDISQFKITFFTDASNYASIDNVEDYYVKPYGLLTTSTVDVGEWQHVEFSRGNVTGTACADSTAHTATCTKTGTVDWSNITKVQIDITSDDTNTAEIYLDQLEYFDAPAFGFFIVRIDHLDDGVFEIGAKIFEDNDIIPQLAGTNVGVAGGAVLNAAQIEAIKSKGWGWSDHGGTHSLGYNLTSDQAEADIVASIRSHRESGDSKDMRFFVLPFGNAYQTSYVQRDLVKEYYTRGFSYIGDSLGVWTQREPWFTNGTSQWFLPVAGASPTAQEIADEITYFEKVIDDVSTYKSQASLLLHDIDAVDAGAGGDTGATISTASLTTLMEYLSAKITSTAGTDNMIVNATYSDIEDLWSNGASKKFVNPDVISRNAMLNQAYYSQLAAIKTILESDTNYTAGDIKLLVTPIDGSGTERDYSGLGHDMTYTDTMTINYIYEKQPNGGETDSIYQPMVSGFASGTHLIQINDHADFSMGDGAVTDNEFGACTWVDVQASDGGQVIFAKADAGAGNQGWAWVVNTNEVMQVILYDNDTSNALYKLSTTNLNASAEDSGIHHLCFTYNPSAGAVGGSERIIIYVDGVADSSGNDNNSIGTYVAMHDDGGKFYYGNDTRLVAPFVSGVSTGFLVKDMVMGADTILKLYNAGIYFYKPYAD